MKRQQTNWAALMRLGQRFRTARSTPIGQDVSGVFGEDLGLAARTIEAADAILRRAAKLAGPKGSPLEKLAEDARQLLGEEGGR